MPELPQPVRSAQRAAPRRSRSREPAGQPRRGARTAAALRARRSRAQPHRGRGASSRPRDRRPLQAAAGQSAQPHPCKRSYPAPGYDPEIPRSTADAGPPTLVIEAYGARLALSAPEQDVLDRIVADLPAGWTRASPRVAATDVEWRFAVMHDDAGGYQVRDGNGAETDCGSDLELAVGLLRLQLRRFVGYHALDLVFVHAGAVTHNGRAIVIPGHSFSGKSTLVAELVRAGAVYYSDEYAVFDKAGLLLPYREPLALRSPSGAPSATLTAQDLGGTSGEEPAPVGLVAVTTYRPGASWKPRPMSPAQGVLSLLEHAVPIRERPELTLTVLRLALAQAEVLEGERGESEATARSLLERL